MMRWTLTLVLVLLMVTPAGATSFFDGCINYYSPDTGRPQFADRITAVVNTGAWVPANKSMAFWPLSWLDAGGHPAVQWMVPSINQCTVGLPCPPASGATQSQAWTSYGGNPDRVQNQFYAVINGVLTPVDSSNNFCTAILTWTPPGLGPACDPLGECTRTTVMLCKSVGGLPTDAKVCPTILGIVDPSWCSCQTRQIKTPLTSAQKALIRQAAQTMNTISAVALGISVTVPSVFNAMKVIIAAGTLANGAMLQIASDPPDSNFTQFQAPVFAAISQPGKDVTLAQATALIAWQSAANRVGGYSQAMATALNRYSGAIVGNGPTWQDAQLDQYNSLVADLTQAISDMEAVQAGFTGSIWARQRKPSEPDLRPVLAPLADPTLLQGLLAASTTDWTSAP